MTTTGRITRDDIEARFRSIQGEAEAVEDEARDYVVPWRSRRWPSRSWWPRSSSGSRRGRSRRAVVEIRRI